MLTPRTVVALVVVQFCFGVWPASGAVLLEQLTTLQIAAWRLLVGGPLVALGLLAFSRGQVFSQRPAPKVLAQLAALSLFGFVINQVAYVTGLGHAGAFMAALFNQLIPVFTLLIALTLRTEKLEAHRLGGAAIALLGAMGLVWARQLPGATKPALGALFLVINASSYAFYLVASRRVIREVGPLTSVAWLFLSAAILASPLLLEPLLAIPYSALTTRHWWHLVFVLIGPTFLTYTLNAVALASLDSSVVALFVFMQPFFTIAAGYLFNDDIPTPAMLTAGGIVVFGVFVATLRAKPAEPSR